jgi:hypothetical protein
VILLLYLLPAATALLGHGRPQNEDVKEED